MAQINCDNITLSYDGNAVIENLSFSVSEGDYLCIVGENGSGKSTLIRAILKQKELSGGSVVCDNRGIGYLPQQTNVRKDFPATVYEIVLSGFCRRMFYTKVNRESVYKIMDTVGISKYKNQLFATLSGGQRQRVLLARALCSAKNILLLDEPAAGLDPIITADIYELIYSINKSGMTVICVSHDIAAAMKYASHILHLSHGSNFYGTVPDYISSDIGKMYIGGCG